MGRKIRAKQGAVLPQLPREVLQHIFSVLLPDGPEPVLSLGDRLRTMAVCTAWRAYLDLKAWPAHSLRLVGSGAGLRIAAWMASNQPALQSLDVYGLDTHQLLPALSISPRSVLTQLVLGGDGRVVRESLAALGLYPRLKFLTLDMSPGNQGGHLDLKVLQPLSALENLCCSRWERVELRGGGTSLPRLTSLALRYGGHLIIDAALIKLQRMEAQHPHSVRLAGEHLQVPQLCELALEGVGYAELQWQAVPRLASLTVVGWRQLMTGHGLSTLDGLSILTHLTSLTLGCWGAVEEGLQAAPPSVHHLGVVRYLNDQAQPPQLHRVPHLTSLTSDSLDTIPRLGPLTRLQHLEFPHQSTRRLPTEQFEWLCGLTSLRRLCFGRKLEKPLRPRPRRVVVTTVLPTGCALERPFWEDEVPEST